MPSSYFDSNADDRHDRDFARFQSDERRRRAVVSEMEITEKPIFTPEPTQEQPTDTQSHG